MNGKFKNYSKKNSNSYNKYNSRATSVEEDQELNQVKPTGRKGPNIGASRARIKDAVPPNKEPEKSMTYYQFQKKYFKELAYPKTIQVSPNPNEEVSRMSDPYAVINRTNNIFDAKYPGPENTSGNIVLQLARGSNSTMQHVVDAMDVLLSINYNYAKLTPTAESVKSVNDQIQNIWLEVQSTFQSQSFYQLPFFSWQVEKDKSGGQELMFDDPILDAVYYYQAFIQQGLNVALTYRKIMSLEKELKDMTFYKGSPIVGHIFGLLKKSSFRAAIDQVAKGLASNYADEAWTDQISTLYLTPSRKSASMLDPLINLRVKYERNDNIKVTSGAYEFSTASMVNYFTKSEEFINKLTCQEILTMARTSASVSTINTWFNSLVDSLGDMVEIINQFNNNFADMNTAFERMYQTGYTSWAKGVFIDIKDIDSNFKPEYNLMIEDLVRSIFSGGSSISYDTNIMNWVLYELNDKYLGIPRYAQVQGGAFLTFSAKNINGTGAPDNIMYPVLYKFVSASFTRRDGAKAPITRAQIAVKTSPELSRILSVSSIDDITINLPEVDVRDITAMKGKSWMIYALMSTIGCYRVRTGSSSYDMGVDPDKLFLVDVVQEDVTNQMLNHIRLTSPFKVIKPTKNVEMGFVI